MLKMKIKASPTNAEMTLKGSMEEVSEVLDWLIKKDEEKFKLEVEKGEDV